jgi:hypothetical protein
MAKLSPEDDPSSIGNILVSMGAIDRMTLIKLVAMFNAEKDTRLGEFLQRHADVPEGTVELALMKQRRMRGENSVDDVRLTLKAAKETQDRVLAKVGRVSMMAMEFKKCSTK